MHYMLAPFLFTLLAVQHMWLKRLLGWTPHFPCSSLSFFGCVVLFCCLLGFWQILIFQSYFLESEIHSSPPDHSVLKHTSFRSSPTAVYFKRCFPPSFLSFSTVIQGRKYTHSHVWLDCTSILVFAWFSTFYHQGKTRSHHLPCDW